MRNRPPYAIDSVDHALYLAQLLQQEGPLGVAQAAKRLDVARSTAHRLLAMLVYRDFAEQGEDRRYYAGPVLSRTQTSPGAIELLREVALPRSQVLVARVHETVNLQVRVGLEVRFVDTVECGRALRVGDRAGRVLPAHLASGGKILLAVLENRQVADLYAADDTVDVARLLKELALVRARGFAVNDQRTEPGVTAVGVLVRGPERQPLAALSLAFPTVRFNRKEVPSYVSLLTAAADGIQQDLANRKTGQAS